MTWEYIYNTLLGEEKCIMKTYLQINKYTLYLSNSNSTMDFSTVGNDFLTFLVSIFCFSTMIMYHEGQNPCITSLLG